MCNMGTQLDKGICVRSEKMLNLCDRVLSLQRVRLQDDKGALLVCERCDKAYHIHCLTPPLDHTPSTGWSCKVR